MAPKKTRNSGNKKPQVQSVPSKFKQDIAGILLIAIAIFIFLADLSSATGLLGLFLVNKALRSVIGVGVYILPVFVALYGVIMLLRHEVKELTVRLCGLLVMFLVIISMAQFASPHYFTGQTQYNLAQGGGGVTGYAVKFALEKSVGLAGAYVLLAAFAFIATLLLFNLTVQSLLALLMGLLNMDKNSSAKELASKVIIPKLLPKPASKEVIPAPPLPVMPLGVKPEPKLIVEIAQPKYDPEPEAPANPTIVGKPKRSVAEGEQGAGGEEDRYADYKLPSLDLLEDTTAKERQQAERLKETTELRKKLLEDALRNFGVGASVVAIFQGPAVTRYEVQPEPGVKVNRIANLADDIALNLAAQGVRIEAPVPGKSVVGIEVPNATVTPVRLKEIVKTNEFMNAQSLLTFAIGLDLAGQPIYGDLGKMPHLLIAGTTGSGKSVCVNSLITSILMRARPDEVKMLMIDPKMVELSVYDGIAHLVAPVVTDSRRAAATLKEWVIKEMERRYRLFHDTGARNLQSYNHKVGPVGKLPFLVVIVDELADLMMIAAKEVETSICRIAQMARATGIHLVIATQRPSVDVITGLIKANIPSRIAFAVATQIDSRVILDTSG
ncbi:MAG: DNA translocase FtsK 4TM domain-containing protein, partial [Candidatus Margulisiibacteriota bacterium]